MLKSSKTSNRLRYTTISIRLTAEGKAADVAYDPSFAQPLQVKV